MTRAAGALVLCSTPRLARSLRLAHGRSQMAQGLSQWQPLRALTVAQWLEQILAQALLAGNISAEHTPKLALGTMQERILWERVIEASLAENPALVLFDRSGLAQAAMEAHRLLKEWNVALGHEQTEETRQFQRWRTAFEALCRKLDALDAAGLFELQVEALQQSAAALPVDIYLAGFDRISPQESRLIEALQRKGCQVRRWPLGLDEPGAAIQAVYDDAESECRAAAAWARDTLERNPSARLAIVLPELGALRARLTSILDDVLHPTAIHPALAETPRRYDFSLGTPLSVHPLTAAALALLRVAAQRYGIPQQDVSSLLANPYWSAAEHEADARARLDARMRRKLGATLGLDQVLKLARGQQGLPVLSQHLEALVIAWPRRQPPSAWSIAFGQLLKSAGWPGERGLSSHEFQARQAWNEVLADFARLDALLASLSAAEALQRLTHLCRERIYQPETVGEPRLQVMGMLESQGAPLDAVWVMGMNDHLWPPPARPNPLLPAEAQRRAGTPNSCSRVQTEFAQAIHARLLHSAPAVVFSWARKEGERELRMSPLLAGVPAAAASVAPAATLAEQLAQPAAMEWLDDHLAPPVAEGEKVAGGTGLLKAQAICPAWAYYRYRLGARALEEPVEGLDSMDRGTLLHAVLQCFWHGRGSVDLSAMGEAALNEAVHDAIERGIRQFCEAEDKTLPLHFLTLEKQRLHFLLTAWLALEKERGHFTVQECERRVALSIEGIAVEFTLDRIDELEDGRLVVIDYKTGAVISHRSWADTRIAEPQLPIYAALALADGNVAAVCFAKVHVNEQKFIGLAHLPDTLPGVDCLDDARKLFSEEAFPDWPSVLAHWKTCITAIAREIREGEAAVRFADEGDLAFCEVKPLLRLPERKLQYERGAAGHE